MRALIIDDDLEVMRSIRRLLRSKLTRIDTCTDRTCMATIDQCQYDLIICDVMMPTLTGSEIYSRVSPDLKRKFVFLSGGGSTSETKRFISEMKRKKKFFSKSRVEELFSYVSQLHASNCNTVQHIA